MGRAKFRFKFRPTIVERTIPAIPTEEPKIQTVSNRLSTFFEHGSLQTVIGIVGGLAGTFLDGRYFAVLGLYLSFALHRSRTLLGVRRGWGVLIHIIVVSIASTLLFKMGVLINVARPHVYTPAEYLAAVKAGTPLPVTQQINHYYYSTKTTKAEKTHAHVVFLPSEKITENALGNTFVNVTYVNQGPGAILHESPLQAELNYENDQDAQCNKKVFTGFEAKRSLLGTGPLLAVGETSWHSFSPSNSRLPSTRGLYLVALVVWSDDAGKWETTFFRYFSFDDNQWHDCLFGNGEHRL